MGELREYANEFENLSKSVVEYLLRDTNAIITLHIPQELRIRSRGTERHSASN